MLEWPLRPFKHFIMIRSVVTVALFSVLSAQAAPQSAPLLQEKRCGWYWNPTPGNAWLVDAKGQWLISSQAPSAPEAEGEWPSFPDQSQWVVTNAGSYGYGCACMTVTRQKGSKNISKIIESNAQPLAICLADKHLRKPE